MTLRAVQLGGSSAAANQGVKDFGAKGDAQKVTDGNTTGGSNTVTSATATFTTADVGKKIWGIASDGTVLFAGRTITARNSATSVTASGAAITGFTNLSVVWGTDDTAAIQAAGASALSLKGKIYFPAGGYIISSMLFDFRFSGVQRDAPPIIGDGAGLTTFYLDPNFDFGSVPAGQSTILAGANILRQNMAGFTLDASYAAMSASGFSGLTVRGVSGFVEDVWVINMNGFTNGLQIQANQTFVSKCHVERCGYIGTDVNSCAATFFECYSGNCNAFGVMFENINGAGNIGFYSRWIGGIIDESVVSAAYVNNSTDVSFIGTKMFGAVGSYGLIVDGGSKVRVTNSEIIPFGVTGDRGGLQVLSGGVCNLGQTRIAGSGARDAINNAGTLINAGGNTVTGTVTGTGLGAVV